MHRLRALCLVLLAGGGPGPRRRPDRQRPCRVPSIPSRSSSARTGSTSTAPGSSSSTTRTRAWTRGGPAARQKFDRTITVPFCFESRSQRHRRHLVPPLVWYRRDVTMPAGVEGPTRAAQLRRGGLPRHGLGQRPKLAGDARGRQHAVRLRRHRLLKARRATRSSCAPRTRPPTASIPRGKQYWEPKSRGIFYTRTSGIWQTVWLEAVGDSYLDRACASRRRSTARCASRRASRGRRPASSCARRSAAKAQVVAPGEAPVDGGRASLGLAVVDPTRACGRRRRPNLYDVTLRTAARRPGVDRVQTRTSAIRSVGVDAQGPARSTAARRTCKMVLDQGYWPEIAAHAAHRRGHPVRHQDDARRWASTARASTRRSRTRASSTGPTRWASSCRARWPTPTCTTRPYVARFTREWIEARRARLQPPVDRHVGADQRELGHARTCATRGSRRT